MSLFKSDKKNKYYLLLFFLIILFVLIFVLKDKDRLGEPSNNTDYLSSSRLASEDEVSPELSPEDVLKRLGGSDEDEVLSEDISLSIAKPEGEVFYMSQARMWEGDFSNVGNLGTKKVDCLWSFYLNENNEEVLYKTLEKSSAVSSDRSQVCGFTSTFIDKKGQLRVELKAEIKNYSDKVLGTYQAERTYTVI